MEIRQYKDGDEYSILDLFLKSFGKPLSLDIWNWRYANNPFTEEKMIYLMWDDDVLAGHYAISPVEMNIFGSINLTGLSMTTMTHPDYGGKGIFTNLAGELYRFVSQKYGVEAVWGFPNLNSHYGFIKKLEWKDIAVVHNLSLYYSNNLKIGLHDYYVGKSIEDVHVNKLNNNTKVSVNKTKDYLQWRYFTNPSNKYFVLEVEDQSEWNFVVIKVFDSFNVKGKKEIDVLEIGVGDDINSIRNVISAIMKFCHDNKLDWLRFNIWMAIFDSRHSLLERLGFVLDSPLTMLGYRAFTNGVTPMENFSNWDISMGASDVY